MGGLFHLLFKKNSNNNKKESNEQQNKTQQSKLSINRATDKILTSFQPKVYSMAEEMNICAKISEEVIATQDGNLSIGFELLGTSYAALTLEEEAQLIQNKVEFFNKINSQLEINIVTEKKLSKSTSILRNSTNEYANEIIKKYGSFNQDIYNIRYFLIVSTTKKILTGSLESFRDKITKEQNEENTQEKIYQQKYKLLIDFQQKIFGELSMFRPRILSSDDLINFYASYANADETNLKYTYEILSDCFITSNATFYKNYILHNTNENKEIYSCFISIKAYESENISSLLTSKLLRCPIEYTVFLHLRAYDKEKAIKKIRETSAFSAEIVKNELSDLLELITADRENLIEVSYSIYLKADSQEELNENANTIINILKLQGLSVVREDLNQKALYFSFFASRGNLNARKKTLKTSNLSTICTFEKEITGFNKNDWGDEAVTTFRHLNGTPFFFNFHCEENADKPLGHTMIIGGSSSGKTTLTQFLMCNLFKYDIDILALDKLNGMYAFTNYVNGTYSTSDDFKINPFSLDPTPENLAFLEQWLNTMAGLSDENAEEKRIIQETLTRVYNNKETKDTIQLTNFIESISSGESSKELANLLKTKFNLYKDSIFNNSQDALNFTQQLSVINMDGLTNSNKTNSALLALYIFHKLKNRAKNGVKRGFFCFIDEFRDYVEEENLRNKIVEAVLEARKIGGVMCLAFQDISIFDKLKDAQNFLGNMANYIIYPTTSAGTLEMLKNTIGLTESEAKFLQETDMRARKVLLKSPIRQESAVLDVNLMRLGNHLKIFSSSADNVKLIKQLKDPLNPQQNWREQFLNHKG